MNPQSPTPSPDRQLNELAAELAQTADINEQQALEIIKAILQEDNNE